VISFEPRNKLFPKNMLVLNRETISNEEIDFLWGDLLVPQSNKEFRAISLTSIDPFQMTSAHWRDLSKSDIF